MSLQSLAMVPPAVLLTQSRSQSPSEVDVSSEPSSMTLLVLFEALDAGFLEGTFFVACVDLDFYCHTAPGIA